MKPPVEDRAPGAWPCRVIPFALALTLAPAGLFSQISQTGQPAADPSKAEVPLPSAAGWRARLVFDAGVGVWTVACYQVQPWFGCPEIVALDDRGRCTVLRSYSGKWTPQPTIEDGGWLAPVACGDLDARHAGVELYAGGKGGRLWQLAPRRPAHFDSRIIGEWSGEEIHTLALGDIDPQQAGNELLVFLLSGRVHLVTSGETGLVVRAVQSLPGRVRQAVVLPAARGTAPWVATVSRVGELILVRLRGTKLECKTVAKESMGLGRIAITKAADGAIVFYVTRDDGIILRFKGSPEAAFTREIVMVGAQGPRGIVAGRFHEDPRRECLAVFGYSKKVVFLSRAPGQPWESEVIFTDIDKGHWLAAGEVDGRNGTEELIGSGYGGRVFLLTRPPGYGLRGVSVSKAIGEAPARQETPAIRVGLRARAGGAEKLTPLRYTGGFEPKTMIYETLVRRGHDGRLVPGLAESWSFEDKGRRVRFVLREGARFHDGTPVTAAVVRQHFRRWIGFPEHRWLPSNARIKDVTVESDRVFRVVMDRPWAVLPDLCAVNPCAIVGPGARDGEGEFVRPVGTGAFRFVAAHGGKRWSVEPFGAADAKRTPIDVMVFPRGGNELPIDALLRGEIEVFVGGWDEDLPAERLRDLERDPGIRVVAVPGSSVVSLRFRLTDGPTADLEVRRRIAAAISRSEIIRRAEGGYADPCTAWAAPAVKLWPRVRNRSYRGASPGVEANARRSPGTGPSTATKPIRIAVGRNDRTARVAHIVAEQLTRAGLRATVVEGREGDVADITVGVSHGVPYDPHMTFGSGRRGRGVPQKLRELVDEAAATPGEEARIAIYARIQELLDREVLMVPLHAPRRLALHTADVEGIRLGMDMYHVDLTGLRRR
ncbi:MAG: ABC transporter substrate-binding protein [Planctomycetota bacterium]|jgi:ABC-type transport system substrate-binding protein